MKLHEVQPFVADAVANVREFVAAGLSINSGIFIEDGTYPKTPKLEETLERCGLAIVVWQVSAIPSIEESPFGTAVFDVFLPVIVEENVKRNRAHGGTGITDEMAAELIMGAVVGLKEPGANAGTRPFRLLDLTFKRFLMQDGVSRIAVNVVKRHVITPDRTDHE